MAIDLATGFNVGSKDAIDERQVLTFEQMKNLDESIYPDKYFAICKDDGKLYIYDADNEINDETGKFRVLEGSAIGDGTVDLTGYKKTYTSKSELFVDSSPTSIYDIIVKLEEGEMFLDYTRYYNLDWFPTYEGGAFRIIKGGYEDFSDTTVEWFGASGSYAIAVLNADVGVERWIVLGGTGKSVYSRKITLGTWNLLARIKLSSSDTTKHILSFSCLNQVPNGVDYVFNKDADLCKYELHFTIPDLTSAYNSTKLTQFGLVLYEYPMPEGTADGIKNLAKNIGLYYDREDLSVSIFIINTSNTNYLEGRYIGSKLMNVSLEYTGEGTIVESLQSNGYSSWGQVSWNDMCAFEDLEYPTIVPIGGDGGSTEGTKTYTSLEELGLTANATVDDVLGKLQPGETFTAGVTQFTNYQTLFPYDSSNDQYSRVFIQQGSSLATVYVKWFRKDGSREALANLNSNNKVAGWNEHTMNEIIHTSLTETLSGITTTLDLINALITEYRAKQKPVRFISGNLTKTQLADFPSNYGLLDITVAGYDLVEVRFAQSEYGFKKMFYGFLNRASGETLFSKLTWSKSNNIYYTIDELNAVKGTSIELVKGEDNTIKIVEALSDREEFVEWFNNGSTMERFGIPDEFGNKITYLRIVKTDSQYALIMATTSRGFTFSRVYNLGVLEDWYYDKTKATLVTNTTTLKLDVTKRNSGWYGAIKVTYLYDTSPAEIEISFRAATEDLRWAVINGQKYVKQITFTQDSSNTAHYTIGIEFTGTTYGCYQAEVIGGFADINSLTNEAFTGTKTAVYYSPWGKNNGVTLVSAPEDIGLTYPCTTVQLAQAMRNKFNVGVKCGAIGLFNCEGKTSTITDAPSNYGLLHVETFGHDRILIRFDGIGSSCYDGSWIGQIKGSNGTFSSITWSRNDNIYSETEQVVGTWIDGSTVYRTTIVYTFTDGAYEENKWKTIGTISGCNRVLKMEGTVLGDGSYYMPIPSYTSSAYYGNLMFIKSNSTLSYMGSALSEGAQIIVTMEYTKS